MFTKITARPRRAFLEPSDVGRPHWRNSNPILAGYLYRYRQIFWDCYMVAVNTLLPKITMFQQPISGQYITGIAAAIQKSLYHTNMTAAGAFPSPGKFFARSMAFSFRSDIVIADAERLVFDMMLSFKMLGQSFLDTHAYKASCAGGLYANSSAVFSNGFPLGDPKNAFVFSGNLGEVIEQLLTFTVEANPTLVSDASGNTTYTTQNAGGKGVNAFVHFDGEYSRGVL